MWHVQLDRLHPLLAQSNVSCVQQDNSQTPLPCLHVSLVHLALHKHNLAVTHVMHVLPATVALCQAWLLVLPVPLARINLPTALSLVSLVMLVRHSLCLVKPPARLARWESSLQPLDKLHVCSVLLDHSKTALDKLHAQHVHQAQHSHRLDKSTALHVSPAHHKHHLDKPCVSCVLLAVLLLQLVLALAHPVSLVNSKMCSVPLPVLHV